ncbi:helix-turn-helix domain-containing protein [Tenacibaculum agarivorans]|uniref:helix-turn-helix domain-containing protein n=1 Tax=Tenacibaculum agarivorans TaxID=1908389 RepID=UPI00094B9D62|nr:helix-turn-helix domain-containing protein [Tenacibaculum agarivorans]
MDEIRLIELAFLGATIIIAILFIIALLVIKKGKKIANLFLVAIVLLNTLGCFTNLFMFSSLYKHIPLFTLVIYPFVFIAGPVYYFYIQLLLYKDFKFKVNHVLHLIPLVWGFHQIKWFFPLSFDEKVNVLTNLWFGEYTIGFTEFITFSIPNFILIVYLIVSLLLILKTDRNLKNDFSSTDIEYLSWLKKFTFIYLTLILIDVGRLGAVTVLGWSPGEGEIITNLLLSILTQYYIFQTIVNPDQVFYQLSIKKTSKVSGIDDKQTYSIDHDFLNKLSLFMEENKPYLNPELKSHELAIMLGVTPNYLSKIINKEFNINFYNFVNQYRVEEFKKEILKKENKNLTLLAVAQSAGFNSKASFNRIFKSITLITPTQYIKQKMSA